MPHELRPPCGGYDAASLASSVLQAVRPCAILNKIHLIVLSAFLGLVVSCGSEDGDQGNGGGGNTSPPPGNTPVPGCGVYDTVAKMDDFFALRCGNANCHAPLFAVAWQDFQSPNVWMRMFNKQSAATCDRKARVIDAAHPENSMMLVKTKQMTPMCPPGTSGLAGTLMPTPRNMEGVAPLTDAEVNCLQNFVNAVVGKK